MCETCVRHVCETVEPVSGLCSVRLPSPAPTGTLATGSPADDTDHRPATDRDGCRQNGDGMICRSEFVRALKSYGCPASEADILSLFDKWDINGDGSLALIEIQKIMRKARTRTRRAARCRCRCRRPSRPFVRVLHPC